MGLGLRVASSTELVSYVASETRRVRRARGIGPAAKRRSEVSPLGHSVSCHSAVGRTANSRRGMVWREKISEGQTIALAHLESPVRSRDVDRLSIRRRSGDDAETRQADERRAEALTERREAPTSRSDEAATRRETLIAAASSRSAHDILDVAELLKRRGEAPARGWAAKIIGASAASATDGAQTRSPHSPIALSAHLPARTGAALRTQAVAQSRDRVRSQTRRSAARRGRARTTVRRAVRQNDSSRGDLNPRGGRRGSWTSSRTRIPAL